MGAGHMEGRGGIVAVVAFTIDCMDNATVSISSNSSGC